MEDNSNETQTRKKQRDAISYMEIGTEQAKLTGKYLRIPTGNPDKNEPKCKMDRLNLI